MYATPAMDLTNGACAHRLYEGAGAAALARDWARIGFHQLYVRDLDGGGVSSAATVATDALVEQILREGSADVSVSGDVQSADRIDQLLAAGASRIIVGTRALDEPEWLVGIASAYPGLIVLETEVRNRRVASRGWIRTLHVDLLDLVGEFSSIPLGAILVTAVEMDDNARSSSLALIEDLVDGSPFPVIVSAGAAFATLDDLHALDPRGVSETILGIEIYDGTLDPRAVAQEFGG